MARRWQVGVRGLGGLLVLASMAYAGGPSDTLTMLPSDDTATLPYVEGEVLVRFRQGASQDARANVHAQAGATVVKSFPFVEDLQHVRLPQGLSVKEAIKLYREAPDVLYVEPNFLVQTLATPNDPSFSSLDGLHNTGQTGGTPDADIDALEAWDLTTGSLDVVVAVIDTGVDYTHPDLAANIWRNTADCNNDGIDDDGNGYIDDCYGIDTFNHDTDPMDDNNHGTHVSGTIGAIGNNGIGVVGVNWNVSIMACKFLGAGGFGFTSDAITCLQYVQTMKDRGVNIIATNNSWGGGGFSQALRDAIDAHRQRGILFIAAAGNSATNNDMTPHYPSSYDLPNVIAVAATDRFDGLASFSSWGRHTVLLGAPGSSILSTIRGNAYAFFSGTSMATPHVTGVAALLKTQDPSRDWRAIKNLLLAGGDTKPSVADTITGKRLNVQGSLTCSGTSVLSRLQPTSDIITASIGTPVSLSALHINCANPNGNVLVTVDPGGQTITLFDDGTGVDQAAGDGIYAGQWTPTAPGIYTLTFPGGDVVTAEVLLPYSPTITSFNWRTIPGTNLNLRDFSSAWITSPFPIRFGGGSFTELFVDSDGSLSFTRPSFSAVSFNVPIPTASIDTLVAPFWDELHPRQGTNQNVFWAVMGTVPHRELVIEWRAVGQLSCATETSVTVTFQVVFLEGKSDILFNYADTTFGGRCSWADRGGAATVGVQVAANRGTQFSFNTPSLTDNTALLWTVSGACEDCRIPSGLVAGTAEGNADDRISIPVEVRNAPDMTDALGFEIHYDPAKLAFVGCDFTGTLLQTWSFMDCSNPALGVVRVGAFTAVDAIRAGTSGTVVWVTFDVLICMEEEAFGLGLRNLVDDVALWQTCKGCFTCVICDGDVNGNGGVTPEDALIDFECFLGTRQCTPGEVAHGDITRDGRLTPGDALCIFNEFLGKLPTLDCVCFSP